MWTPWVIFIMLVLFAAISGIIGGYCFGKIDEALPEGWERFFNTASIVMLAQDVLTNLACMYFITAMGVSLKASGGPVTVTAIFFAVVFISPACGFLLAQR
jgi:ABC-type methionine transport system permease subunit